MLKLLDEIDRAGEGRGAIFVFRQPRQHVEGGVTRQLLVFGGRFVGLPVGRPAVGDFIPVAGQCVGVRQRHGRQVAKDSVDGLQHEGAGAPRLDQRPGIFDGGVPRPVVLVDNPLEQAWVAAAPFVNSLFGVADVEQGAVGVRVLKDFIEKVFDDRPLDERGVLKFVEEPVAKVGVEAAIHEGATTGGNLAIAGSEKLGEIVETELPGAGHVAAVLAAIGCKQAVQAARADDLAVENHEADIGENGGQHFLRFGEKEDRTAAERDVISIAVWRSERRIEAPVQDVAEVVGTVVADLVQTGGEFLPSLALAGLLQGIGLGVEYRDDCRPIQECRGGKQGSRVRPDALGIAPGRHIGCASRQLILILDQARNGAIDTFFLLAKGGLLEGLHQLALLVGGQRGPFQQALENKIVFGVFQRRGNGQFGGNAGFESERAQNLEEK